MGVVDPNELLFGLMAVHACAVVVESGQLPTLRALAKGDVRKSYDRGMVQSLRAHLMVSLQAGRYIPTAAGLAVLEVAKVTPDSKVSAPVMAAAHKLARDFKRERVFIGWMLSDLAATKPVTSPAALNQLRVEYCVINEGGQMVITGFGRLVAEMMVSAR